MSYEDHTYRNITIGIILGVASLVAFLVLFSSPPVTTTIFDDFFAMYGMPNPFHPYKIKTTCELAYFVLHGPPTNSLAQKLSSPEEFQKNFPFEFNQLKNFVLSPEFYHYMSQAYAGTSQPSNMVPPKVSEILASLAIKEYSISPNLKPQLVVLLQNPYDPSILMPVVQNDTCGKEMDQKYANWK